MQRRPALVPSADDAALVGAIMRAAERGEGPDLRAEAELYRRLAPRVRLYGLRHLRDPHAAADLVQQVMMTTLERLRAGALREPTKLASFVLGMCRMTVLDLRRGGTRREQLLERYGDSAAHVPDVEITGAEHERLADCLARLAERERTVLVLSFYAERSADEVARELALASGNVRVIRHRALARLRSCVEAG